MPVRSDDSGRRWVEMELLVPGTPEQVWQAMATGPGMSAWFTPTEVDEKVGGAISFDFGDGCGGGGSAGTITGWEPPLRLVYEEYGWSEGEVPPLATEVTITGRSGDRCVVRMVHSLFASTDQWDDELEGFESGWPGFFEVLRAYLRDFAGQHAAPARVMATTSRPLITAWSDFTAVLGVAGANVGDRRVTDSGAPHLSGAVERVRQEGDVREVALRVDEPAPGIAIFGGYAMGERVSLMVSIYFYGDGADVAAKSALAGWTPWLNGFVGEAV